MEKAKLDRLIRYGLDVVVFIVGFSAAMAYSNYLTALAQQDGSGRAAVQTVHLLGIPFFTLTSVQGNDGLFQLNGKMHPFYYLFPFLSGGIFLGVSFLYKKYRKKKPLRTVVDTKKKAKAKPISPTKPERKIR